MSKKEYNNPEMRCSQFYQISCVIPKNCYNCAMRKGYPYYLFGDVGCENFVSIDKTHKEKQNPNSHL